MNKQNKRKLYTFRHMWIRQALKPANDTRDQDLNYANNIKWSTNHNKLWTKTSPVTSEFLAQRASNAENFSIWWRHHAHHNSLSCMPSQICQCCSGTCTTTLGVYSRSDNTPWSVERQVSNNKELNVTIWLKFDRRFDGTSGEPPAK